MFYHDNNNIKVEIAKDTNISNNISENAKLCRICYEGDELNNMLIQPCQCEGSMKYIHEECLKKWIDEYKKGLYCEICSNKFYIKFFMEKAYSHHLFKKYCKKIIKSFIYAFIISIVLFITIFFLVRNSFSFEDNEDKIQLFVGLLSSFLIIFLLGLTYYTYYRYKTRWYSITMKEWKVYDINQAKVLNMKLEDSNEVYAGSGNSSSISRGNSEINEEQNQEVSPDINNQNGIRPGFITDYLDIQNNQNRLGIIEHRVMVNSRFKNNDHVMFEYVNVIK